MRTKPDEKGDLSLLVENEVRTVLKEKNNYLLARIDSVVNIGDQKYEGIRFEIWSDREKFEQGITDECIDGQNYIYCSGYAGSSEEDVIRIFEKRSEA
ncbi:hypothetical protein [Paenibacillus sp. OK076]|uniref:hypothetical protein n=1 Tax=Paenibacillus sp. OK076 TaxID=1884379 RepID=UPI00115FBF96|nr:hypothetical protein [Paenibacillus sp. OK076]